MKYSKAINVNDKWYVLKGNKHYFADHSFDTEQEAINHAAVMSAEYYLAQAMKAMDKSTDAMMLNQESFNTIVNRVSVLKNHCETVYTDSHGIEEADGINCWC